MSQQHFISASNNIESTHSNRGVNDETTKYRKKQVNY